MDIVRFADFEQQGLSLLPDMIYVCNFSVGASV